MCLFASAKRQLGALTLVVFVLVGTGCVSNGPPEHSVVSGPEKIANIDLTNVKEIYLQLPVGDIDIVRGAPNKLAVELTIGCNENNSGCKKLANSVTLEQRHEGDKLFVWTSKKSRFSYRNSQTDYSIKVPDGIPLTIKAGFGDLSITGVNSDLVISMSAGEVSIQIPESSVRSVRLDANFGDASLSSDELGREGKRKLLVGAEVDWREGSGSHDIQVDLGAGDISVHLTD